MLGTPPRPAVLTQVRPTAVLAVALAAAAVVVTVDPNQPGHYPVCPFHAITGLSCPGCGALRAVHALGQGDVVAALGFNLLAVAVLPFLAWRWWQWARRPSSGGRRRRSVHPALGWAFLAVVVVFTVLRNTPPGSTLAP